jgi:hypothetical protein
MPATVCPHCGSDDAVATRSIASSDGSRTRRMRCRTCGEPFFLVIEEDFSENLPSASRIWNPALGDQDNVAVKIDLISIGRAAVAAQTSPARLERLAKEAGAKAVMTINGVAYFNQADLRKVISQIPTKLPERSVDNVSHSNG